MTICACMHTQTAFLGQNITSSIYTYFLNIWKLGSIIKILKSSNLINWNTFSFRKNYPSLIQTITLDKNRGLQDLSSFLSSPLLLFVLEITCRYPEIITSLPLATRRTWPKMLVSKSEKNVNTYLKNPATQLQVGCVYIKQILLLGQLRQLPRFMY